MKRLVFAVIILVLVGAVAWYIASSQGFLDRTPQLGITPEERARIDAIDEARSKPAQNPVPGASVVPAGSVPPAPVGTSTEDEAEAATSSDDEAEA